MKPKPPIEIKGIVIGWEVPALRNFSVDWTGESRLTEIRPRGRSITVQWADGSCSSNIPDITGASIHDEITFTARLSKWATP